MLEKLKKILKKFKRTLKKLKRIPKKLKSIKGSTIIIALMYLTWIAYIYAQVKIYMVTCEWLPAEVTLATAGLFIVETVSLARLKMAKEGAPIIDKETNPFLEQAGLIDMPDFENEVQQVAMMHGDGDTIENDVNYDNYEGDENG